MRDTILIPREAIDKITNDELCVYLAVYYIAQAKEQCFISRAYIEHTLFESPCKKQGREMIIKGLDGLFSKEYIKSIHEYKSSSFWCDVSKISKYDKSKYYISITYQELRKFVDLESTSKYDLLRYFIFLVGSFDAAKTCEAKYRFKIGKLSESYMSELVGISIPTLIKYNKTLQEKHFIYISKRKTHYQTTSANIQWQSNIYSRYEDKALCEEYAKSTNSIVDTKLYRKQVDENRRYVQMYNAMLKGKKYDKDTIAEIYEGIKAWNEYKKQKYEKQIERGYTPDEPQYKDMKAFEEYGLTS